MGTWMEPGWVPEWEPGWELEWEPEWEAGWEPDWEPGWEPEGKPPNCDQTGTKYRSFGGSLGLPWGLLGAPWEDPWGTPGVPGTGPAPGTQKVPKVYNCRQKQAWTPIASTERYQILGPPRGLSKRPH